MIFCWVLHEQSTIDEILSRLELNEWKLISVSLICTESELVSRLQRDIDAGIRSSDVIARSLERLQHYSGIDSVKVDVTYMCPEGAAEAIKAIAGT